MGGGRLRAVGNPLRGFLNRFWGSRFRVQLSLRADDLGGRKEQVDRESSALASSTLVRIAPWGLVFRVQGLGLKWSLRVTTVCVRVVYMRARARCSTRACWRALHRPSGESDSQSCNQRATFACKLWR